MITGPLPEECQQDDDCEGRHGMVCLAHPSLASVAMKLLTNTIQV